MAPLGWSVELVRLYWTTFWWSCTIDRGDAGLEHWNEVRAEGIDLGILHSKAKKEPTHREREETEEKRGPREYLDRTFGRNWRKTSHRSRASVRRETEGTLEKPMEEIFKAEGWSIVSCTVENQRERGLSALATKWVTVSNTRE